MVAAVELDPDALEQREAAKAAQAAYLATPEGKLATRAQQLSGDYGDVRQVDPKNVPAIEALLTQIGTENEATRAIAATLAQKYGITDLNEVGTRQGTKQEYDPNQEAYVNVPATEYYNKVTNAAIPQNFATYDNGKATYYFGLDTTKDGNLTFNQPQQPNPRASGEFKAIALPALALASLAFDWSGQTGYAILGAGDAVAGAVAAGEMAASISAATGITVGANAIATGIGSAAVNTATTYARTGDINTALATGASSFVTSVGSAAAAGTVGAALTAADVNPALTNYLSSAIAGATGTALAGGSVDLSKVVNSALATAASVGVTNAATPYVGADVAKGLGAATQTYITTGNTDAAIQNGLFTGVGSALKGALQPKKSDYTQEQINSGKYDQDLKNWATINPESSQAAGMGETAQTPIGATSAANYNKTAGEYTSILNEQNQKINEYKGFYENQFKPVYEQEKSLVSNINDKINLYKDYIARWNANDPDAPHWRDAANKLAPEIQALNSELANFRQVNAPLYQQQQELFSGIKAYDPKLNDLQTTLDAQRQLFHTDQSTTGVDENGALTYTPARFDIQNLPQVASTGNLTGIDFIDEQGVAHATLPRVEVTASSIDKAFENAPDVIKQLIATGAQGFGEQITTFANAYSALTGTPFGNAMANIGNNLSIWGANRDSTDLAAQTKAFNADRQKAESMPWYESPGFIVKSAMKNPLGFISEVGKERSQEIVPALVGGLAAAAGLYFGAPIASVAALAAAGSALSDAFESFGSGAKEAYDAAIKKGATEQQARNTGILNGTIHALVTAPTEFIADKALFKTYTDGITKGLTGLITQYGSANVREIGQEVLETYAQGVSTALTTGQPINLNALTAQAWTAGMVSSGTHAGMSTEGAIKDAVVAKDFSGNNVTLAEMTSGSKLVDPSTMRADAVIGTAANGTKQTLGYAMAASRDLGLTTPELSQFMPASMLSNDLVIATLPGGTPVTMADMSRFEQTGGSPQTFMESLSTSNPVAFANTYVSPTASSTESQFQTQTFFDNSVAAKIQAGASPLDATKSTLSSMGIPASGVNLTALSQTLGGQNNAVAAVTTPTTAPTGGTTTSPAAGGATTPAPGGTTTTPGGTTATLGGTTTPASGGTTTAPAGTTTTPVSGGTTTAAGTTTPSGTATTTPVSQNTIGADVAANAIRSAGMDPTGMTPAQMDDALAKIEPGAKFTVVPTVSAATAPTTTAAITAATGTNTAANAATNTAATTGANAAANAATNAANNAATAVTTGVNPAAATGAAVTTAVNNGANTNTATNAAVTGAVTAGANPTSAVTGAVNAATAAGTNPTTATTVATNAATNAATNVATNTAVNTNVNTNVNPNVNPNVTTGGTATSANAPPATVAPPASAPPSNAALDALQAQIAAQNKLIADEAAKKKAADDEANRVASNQRAMQFLAPAAKPASSNNVLPAVTASIIGGKSGFVSPLEAFSKMVQKDQYIPQQQQQPEGALMQASPYAYGKQTDLNEIFGLNDQQDQVEQQAKSGGLMTPLMATGGTTRYGKFAGGGLNVVHHAGKMRVDFRSGDAVTGAGDGQSDDIPAMLADGEFVIPADVVAALGNGSTKAGSDALYEMMHSIRARARKGHPKSLPPPAKSPLDYISKRK
jgi:hypothetical protein